jgi:hypothetical protein
MAYYTTHIYVHSYIYLEILCKLWDILLCSLLNAGILLGLFDHEDGGDMFLRNIS